MVPSNWTGVSKFKASSIGGFGRNEEAVLWNIEDFVLSDKNNSITYKEMEVAVVDKPKIPCDMTLSASMSMKMKYVIDCSLRKHVLTIMAVRNVYGVGYYNRKETIYIFSGK